MSAVAVRVDSWTFTCKTWRYAIVAGAIRFGRLRELIEANRSWLDELRDLCPRRWRQQMDRIGREEEAKRLARVRANQPYGADA